MEKKDLDWGNLSFSYQPTDASYVAHWKDGEWDEGEINIRYEMDKLNFDWRMGQGEVQFVPGNIEFTVTQQPDVIIKYIGGPVYVPPSADPEYEPVDARA